MNQGIQYLYHYTSIETLALILKSKKIRFKRLDLVDDPEESKTLDYGNLGRFCFVSCWTNMEEESIPMWKMYAGNEMNGVRIKLPIYIFPKYKLNPYNHRRYEQDGITHDDFKTIGNDFYSYINVDNFRNMIVPLQENILNNVEYTNDQKLLYPEVLSYNEHKNSYSLKIGLLGKYKYKSWEFQQEVRYKIFINPWRKEEFLETKSPEALITLFNRFKDSNLPFEYIDLDVNKNKFEDMTIRLSPKAILADKIIVESLLKEYNPNAIIEESNIKIR